MIELMVRLVAQGVPSEVSQVAVEEAEEPGPPAEGEPVYWLTPVKSDEERTAEDAVRALVVDEKIYAWSERTPGRRHLKPGDWMCFYATGIGVVGHARVVSAPTEMEHPAVSQPDRYRWIFKVDRAEFYADSPVVIDAALRSRLGAFEGRDPNRSWAWFVQGTHKVTEHDFRILTRQ